MTADEKQVLPETKRRSVGDMVLTIFFLVSVSALVAGCFYAVYTVIIPAIATGLTQLSQMAGGRIPMP